MLAMSSRYGTGIRSLVSLQLCKNMVKQSYGTHHVKAGTCSVQ